MLDRRLSFWIALFAALAFSPLAVASIQEDDICWSPDVEFPTTCDDEDD